MKQLESYLPPVLYKHLRQSRLRRYGWSGNYPSWDAAKAASTGYDADEILEKVLHATLLVKDGKYPYERDSVLYEEIQYDWPLLSGLLWVAAMNQGELNVLDFGGSLGSTYWQNLKFFRSLKNLHWNIVEQPHYVAKGQQFLQNDQLSFYPDIASCLRHHRPNLVLVSSVLNYVQDPYALLTELFNLKIRHIILERVPFIAGSTDRLTVQRVPPKIYKASYPAWFFSETRFLDFIKTQYDIHELYDCGVQLTFPSEMKGLILQRKANS